MEKECTRKLTNTKATSSISEPKNLRFSVNHSHLDFLLFCRKPKVAREWCVDRLEPATSRDEDNSNGRDPTTPLRLELDRAYINHIRIVLKKCPLPPHKRSTCSLMQDHGVECARKDTPPGKLHTMEYSYIASSTSSRAAMAFSHASPLCTCNTTQAATTPMLIVTFKAQI